MRKEHPLSQLSIFMSNYRQLSAMDCVICQTLPSKPRTNRFSRASESTSGVTSPTMTPPGPDQSDHCALPAESRDLCQTLPSLPATKISTRPSELTAALCEDASETLPSGPRSPARLSVEAERIVSAAAECVKCAGIRD